MIHLEPVANPLSPESIQVQASILNSQPAFNMMVVHQAYLAPPELLEENKQNLAMGEKMLYIKTDHQHVGLITYLPEYTGDHQPWIGLLVVHQQHNRQGIGREAVRELEQLLQQEGIHRIRLAVQLGNTAGEAFWTNNGFTLIRIATDNHNNEVGVYEKQFK
jgi:GNAT superfamily N-acetyltransferase